MPENETDLEKNEFEYYCFPEQEEMVKVKKSNGGRVYTFHSKMNEERFFFWMQDPDESKDQEFVANLNKHINLEDESN